MDALFVGEQLGMGRNASSQSLAGASRYKELKVPKRVSLGMIEAALEKDEERHLIREYGIFEVKI